MSDASPQAPSSSQEGREDYQRLAENLRTGTQVLSDRTFLRLLDDSEATSRFNAPPRPLLRRTRSDGPSQASSYHKGNIVGGSGAKREGFLPETPEKPAGLTRAATEIRTDDLKFGVTRQQATEVPGSRCGVCFTDSADLPRPPRRFCSNLACKGAYCDDCFGTYVAGKVNDALHFAPPIKCPGCKGRIPTDVWTAVVDREVIERYKNNAASLLTIRCHSCDNVSSLLVGEQKRNEPLSTAEEEARQIGVNTVSQDKDVGDMWFSFSLGRATPDRLFTLLRTRIFGKLQSSSTAEALSKRETAALTGTLEMIEDVERKVSLQLSWLRQHPKILTPCCSAKTCFKCKVDGWHTGVSCEVRQRKYAERAEGIQSCPECGVPTQRTEGCMQVACVCGHRWEWKHDDGDEENEETPWPLPLVICQCVCEGGTEAALRLFRAISQRINLSEAIMHPTESCFNFAARRPGAYDGVEHFTPSCDPSRLEALLQLKEEGIFQFEDSQLQRATGDEDNETPLFWAVYDGNLESLKILVKVPGAAIQDEVWKLLGHEYGGNSEFHLHKTILKMVEPLVPAYLESATRCYKIIVHLFYGRHTEVRALLEEDNLNDFDYDDEDDPQFLASAFLLGSWYADVPKGEFESMMAFMKEKAEGFEARLVDSVNNLLEFAFSTSGVNGWKAEEGLIQYCFDTGVEIRESEDGDEDAEDTLFYSACTRNSISCVTALVKGCQKPRVDTTLKVVAREFVSPKYAGEVVKLIQSCDLDWDAAPLWLALQLGPTREIVEKALARELENPKEGQEQLDEAHRVAISWIRRSLFEGKPTTIVPEAVFTNQVSEAFWKGLKQQAATALLHLVIRQAKNLEIDPDPDCVAKLLNEFGADASSVPSDFKDVFRETALVASYSGEDLPNTPLLLLCRNGFCTRPGAEAIVSLLEKAGADLNSVDEDGDSMISNCLAFRNNETLQVLFDHGVKLDKRLASDALNSARIRSEQGLDLGDEGQRKGFVEQIGFLALCKMLEAEPDFERPEEAWQANVMEIMLGPKDSGWSFSGTEWMQNPAEIPGQDLNRHFAKAYLLSYGRHLAAGSEKHLKTLEDLRNEFVTVITEETWETTRNDAAKELMQDEVRGAFLGRWKLASDFVVFLLEQGADAGTIFPNIEDSDLEDDDEEEEGEELDMEEEQTGNDSRSVSS